MTINVTAGVGMLAAAIRGSVLLGVVQDHGTTNAIAAYDARNGTRLEANYTQQRPASLLGSYRALNEGSLARAPQGDRAVVGSIVEASKLSALRDVALLPVFTTCAFLLLALAFRRRAGGEALSSASGGGH